MDPIDAQKINRWRDGVKLCAKRDTYYSFFNSPTSCTSSSTYHACGKGDSQVCRPTNLACPISNFHPLSDSATSSTSKVIELYILNETKLEKKFDGFSLI